MKEKALVAMSGGVDSSVAAYLTQKAGFACIGVTMKLFHNDDVVVPREHSCCSLEDVEDARSVARMLQIPYYVFNFTGPFREKVLNRFIQAYEHGETPNPCIDCNRSLKFEALYRRARELGCHFVVTGHYARIERDETTGRYLLKKAVDPAKDQSYVLYSLTQEQLAHTQFPLGNLPKPQVRALAAKQGFWTAEKPDSQDICFVQDGNYADFIRHDTKKEYPRGHFVDPEGRVLGEHRGIIHYTIGQRRGLGLSFAKPHYVCGIDPVKNEVCLGEESALYSRTLTAREINLIDAETMETPRRVKAKVRYRQAEQWAIAVQTGADTLRITFDEPQRAITKGQAVVLYDGETVVGGGTIASVEP